jgi:hypothetical protein
MKHQTSVIRRSFRRNPSHPRTSGSSTWVTVWGISFGIVLMTCVVNSILLMPDTKSELWDMDSDIVSVTGVVISQGELTL